ATAKDPQPTSAAGSDPPPLDHQTMAMLQIQRLIGIVAVVLFASAVQAQPAAKSGTVIDVSGTKGGKYPIALPTAPENDAVAKESAAIQSFTPTLVGPFKGLDPQSFLADLRAE